MPTRLKTWQGTAHQRYDPDGKRERRIMFPAAQTSLLAFGGPDLDVIFVTSASLNNMLEIAPLGYDPAKVYVGGRIYRMRADVQGRKEYRSRIQRNGRAEP
jgi:sugar lactone lactonase YvrE